MWLDDPLTLFLSWLYLVCWGLQYSILCNEFIVPLGGCCVLSWVLFPLSLRLRCLVTSVKDRTVLLLNKNDSWDTFTMTHTGLLFHIWCHMSHVLIRPHKLWGITQDRTAVNSLRPEQDTDYRGQDRETHSALPYNSKPNLYVTEPKTLNYILLRNYIHFCEPSSCWLKYLPTICPSWGTWSVLDVIRFSYLSKSIC